MEHDLCSLQRSRTCLRGLLSKTSIFIQNRLPRAEIWWLAKEVRKEVRRSPKRSWRACGQKGRKRASEVPFSFLELPLHTHTHKIHLSLVHPQLPGYWERHPQTLTTGSPETTCSIYVFPQLPNVPHTSKSLQAITSTQNVLPPPLFFLPQPRLAPGQLLVFFQDSAQPSSPLGSLF